VARVAEEISWDVIESQDRRNRNFQFFGQRATPCAAPAATHLLARVKRGRMLKVQERGMGRRAARPPQSVDKRGMGRNCKSSCIGAVPATDLRKHVGWLRRLDAALGGL
jgi:hypothetical protein